MFVQIQLDSWKSTSSVHGIPFYFLCGSWWSLRFFELFMEKETLEMPGIEPGAFHMQSERSTTELHPLMC